MRKKKEPKPTPQPVSKFTQGFSALCYDRGWKLPDPYVHAVYEARLCQLEAEIEVLTGGRSKGAPRINPMEKSIPS